jgi:hypothetical protein
MVALMILGLRGRRRRSRVDQTIESSAEEEAGHRVQKARLTAALVQDGSAHCLLITNSSDALATSVRVKVDDVPLLEHPTIPRGTQEVGEVGPRSSIRYLMALTFQQHPPFKIEITWEDESGELGHYLTNVTF